MSYQAKVASLENDVTAVSAFDFDTNIVLSRPSQVLLQVAPEDIASMLRDGNDLVIELTNGETLRVIGFYSDVPGQSPSELYLTGEEDQLIPVELNTLSNGTVIFAASYPEAEYAGFEQGREKGAIYMDDLVPALALGGLGAAAIGLARGSSSSSDSPASPPVDEGEDGVADPVEPDDPIEDGEGDPEVPGEPDDPVVPGDPDDPDVPGDPDDPEEPGDPDDPEEPGDPDDPEEPGDPDDPEEPGDPDDPEEPGDPTPPPAPTLTLVNDTGSSDSDGITRDGTVQVGGLVDGGGWEYSLDGGQTWQAGEGESFVVPEGTYPAGQVQVRQRDADGNPSEAARLGSLVVDTTPPEAPSLTLANDTGEVDGVTTDGTMLVGNLEPNLRWEFSLDGGQSWQAGTGDRFILPEGEYAAGQIQVRQTDAAGNVSDVTEFGPVTVDLVIVDPGDPALPAIPTLALLDDTGSSDSDGITSNGTVVVGGLVEGGTWEYSLDGGENWLVGSGDRFTLAEGEYAADQVLVRQSDADGNTSGTRALGAVVIDQTPPEAPTLALANDVGAPDGVTSNGTIIVSNLEPGARWEFSLDGGQSWQAGSGDRFILAEGVYTSGQVQVRQSDSAGNVSPAGELGAVTIDPDLSEPGTPDVPVAPTLSLGNDTGEIDGITRDGTVNVGGLEPGNRWEFSLDGGATWTVGQGDRFVLPEGEYGQGQVQVRQIDPAGNTSPAGVLAPVVVDTTAPAAPTLTLENDTGEVDGITSDGSVIVGDLEPGARWEYSIDGGASWIVGEGDTFSLPEGTYAAGQVLVRQFDVAGNESATTNLGAVIVDTTAPGMPSLTPSGVVDGVTADGTVRVGDLEPGSAWEFSLDGGATWQRGSGDRFILGEGNYLAGQVQARQVDAAGNVGAVAELGAIRIDLIIEDPDDPTRPPIPTLALANDTGEADGITSDGTVLVGGLVEGGTWEFSLDGGTTWQAGSGDRFVLAEGDYAAGEVLVRQSDADGVTSGTRTVGSVIVDTTAPEAPSVALDNDTGTLDGITADGTVVIGGLEPGALWEVSLDGGMSWQRGVGDRFILAEGDYIEGLVQVRQIDRAGNVSAPVELGPVTVDLTAPQAPTLALDGLDAGITNETLVTVGNLEAGARWEFSLDGGASWTVGTGTSFSLPEGTYGLDQVQVRQTDGAGNVSPATALAPVVIDVTPPAVPVISLVADSAITNDATVSVEGLEEGARWEYSLNGGVSWVVGVGDSFELPEGRYAAGQILTRQIDAAGNVGGVASLGAVEIDITPPPAPLLTLIDAGDDGVTADGTVLVGNLEPTARWEISLDGGVTWQPGTGDRFILAEGSYAEGAVQVRQIDAAGNVSGVVGLGPITVDLTIDPPTDPGAPATPTLALVLDTGSLDGVTSNPAVQVNGVAPGNTWEFSLDGGTTWQTGQGGGFTLTEGTYAAGQVLVRQTSPEGVTSGTSTLGAVTIDLTAPVTPSVTLVVDTGGVDGITRDGTLAIGNLDPNAFWEISLDGGATWQRGTGDRFVLGEGEYPAGAIQVRQTDGAGNVSTITPLGAVTVVTQPPQAPIVERLGDDITRDGTITVEGLQPGAIWQVSLDRGQSWQTVGGDRFVLPEGSYGAGQVQVRQIDGAGNVSAPALVEAVIVDTTAPPAPTATLGDGGAITNVALLEIGNLEAGATWEISVDGGRTWITGEGTRFELADGEYAAGQIQVRQTDTAGNVGKPLALGAVIIDTIAPATPSLTLANDTGTPGDGITADGTLVVGNLEAGAYWEVSFDGGMSWQRGAGDRFVLKEGTYQEGEVQVRQVDAAGNRSEAARLGPVTVDLTVTPPEDPEAPATPSLSLELDSGELDGISSDGNILVGGLAFGATWQYSLNGGVSWLRGMGNGFTLAEGSYAAGQILVRQFDASGRVSGTSTLGAITIDTTPPEAPTVSLVNDNGDIPGLTNDGTLRLGNLETGARWEISLNGGTIWLMVTGERYILPEGSYAAGAIQVRQTDGAGNVSDVARMGAITVDTTLPDAPVIDLLGGEITNDGIVTVGGIEENARWEYSLDGGATWISGRGTSFTLAEGRYGAGTIQVRQIDGAGNVSTSAVLEGVVIDLTPPATPSVTLVADSAITNDGTVEVSGLEPGASWEYSLDGGVTWQVGSGERFVLPEGDYAAGDVRVRQIDLAGNAGASVNLGAVVIDTTPPGVPTLALANDTGTPGDGVTVDGTLLVTGLEAGAVWQFSLDGGVTWQQGLGDRFTLPEGSYASGVIQVRQFDVAGNVSPVADFGPVTVDREVTAPEEPGAPATPTLSLAVDTGALDGITSNGEVEVAGLIDGATWEVSLDGGLNWLTGSGTTFTLEEGTYAAGQVLVRQTLDGLTSGTSTLGAVTVDTTVPEAPTITLAVDTGTLDGITADGTLIIGNLEPGARWEISLNGGVSWLQGAGERFILPAGSYAAGAIQVRQFDIAGNVSGFGEAGAISVVITPPAAPTPSRAGGPVSSETTVEVDGIAEDATWEYTLDGGQTWLPGTGESFTLPEGNYAAGDIRVRQTDGAGNVSVGAPLGAVVIDLTPPAAPTLTLSGEGPITNDGRIDVGGLEPGASWEYSLDGGANWQLGIGAGFTLPEGVYAAETILVRQTDAAGNLGPEVALEPVTIDITPPAAPTATLAADRAITNDGRVEVSDLETGARWEVSLDGGATWQAGVGTGFTLVDGDYAAGDVRVRQIDPAGNTGPSVGLGAVVIDTLEPDAPTLVLVNDTGIVGDGRTADGTLRVQGLEPGANWEFSLDGGTTWQRGSGDRFTLPEGIYEGGAVQVRQFDMAGNVSPVAEFGPITVALEIIAPEEPGAPATPTLSLAEDTGAQDGITSNGVVNVAGLIEGAIWEVSLDGGLTWLTGSGTTFTLEEGTYAAGQVLVRQTLDGLTSGTSTLGAVTIDTTAPQAPTVTLALDTGTLDGITADGTLLVGNLEPGAYWQISLDGGATWLEGVGDRFILPPGSYAAGAIQVRQFDAAGNESGLGEAGAISVVVTPPSAPGVSPTGTGPITNAAAVAVEGILDGATWEYTLDGGSSWLLGTGGGFSLPEGSYAAGEVRVRQIDGAGNVSAATPLEAIIIDLTPPAAPTATLVAGNAITNDGAVEVGSLEPGARWEVTFDGGTSWQAGVGTGFVLDEGDYPAGAVQVRQIDPAGNVGASVNLGAVVVDITPPVAPTLVLVDDTGPVGDGVTADGTLQVGGLELGASWEFSLNGGITWQRGSGDRFTLPEGAYADGAVQVRQFDMAGNVSPEGLFGPITVNLEVTPPEAPNAPATPVLSLAVDTGALDGITSNGLVNVAGLLDGATWEFSLDGGQSWQAGVGNGFTLEEGVYAAGQVLVRQSLNGLTSGTSTLGAVTIDTTAPDVPTVELAIDTGTVDGITANGTLIIGNLEPGARWQISLDGGLSWLEGAGERFILPPGSYAQGAIQVRQFDVAGNVSGSGEADAVSVVTMPPLAPTVSLIGTGPVTNQAAVEVSGIVDGATWEYTLDGGASWLPGSGGGFTLPEESYAAGDIRVRQIDGAGNVSAAAPLGAVTIDLTPPAAPSLTPAIEGAIVNDGRIDVGGLEPGATWEISLDGGQSWQVGVGGGFTLADGDYATGEVQVRQIDRAGNVGAATELEAVLVDTLPPAAPILALGRDGDIINDAVLGVSGIEAGASWEISLDGGRTWQAGSGESFTLPDGRYGVNDIQVRQTDAAGNLSPAAVLGPVVIDTQAPLAPTLVLVNDTGVIGDGITADGTLRLVGLEPGASWEFSLDGGQSWLTGQNGTLVLPEGDYLDEQIRVRQTDAAGNQSPEGTFGPITVDLTITPPEEPNAPATPTLSLAVDTGEADGITSDGTVDVGGLVAGAVWEFSLDGGASWQTGTGASFLLPEGVYPAGQVQVRQSLDGLTSGTQTLASITVDLTPPAALTLTLVSDTGTVDGVTSDGTVRIGGLEEGARWEFSLDGGTTWQVGSGASFLLPEGVYAEGQVLARQFDLAGNEGPDSALAPVTVDVTSPGGDAGSDAPYIALPELVRGFINAEAAQGGIELGVMLTEGTQAGDILTVTLSGGTRLEFDYLLTAEDIAAGMIVVDLASTYPDGRYSVSAAIVDGAGNRSAVSNAIGFELDTTAPDATTTAIRVNPITADNVINLVEAGRSVEISGRVEGEYRSGDVLNVTVNGVDYSVNVGAGGAFSVTVLGSLLASAVPPVVDFELLARDVAGNVGTIETSVGYAVNLATPTITIDPVTGDNVINAQNIANGLQVTGTVEGAADGSTVTLFIGGASFEGTVQAGTWSVRAPAAFLRDLDNGNLELTARVVNEAGNPGQSAPVQVLLDTVRPSATITISDTLIGGGETALVTFTFSEAVTDFTLSDVQVTGGSLVDLSTTNGITWTASFQPGTASGQASIALLGGSYTDLAGNLGSPASIGGITVDIDPPTLNSVTFAIGGRPLTSAESTTVTFAFSEAVTGLTLDDFAVTGGRLTNLTSLNGGATWTATFRPDGLASSASISLPSGSFTDLAGNPGVGGVSPTLPITILQPVLSIAASEDGWINGFEAVGAEVQVGFGGLPVAAGDVVTLNVFARAGGGLAVGSSIATLTYALTATDVANGYARFPLDIATEYTFQPAGARVSIGGSALSQEVDFVLDTVPPGRAVADGTEVAGNGILIDTLLNPGEGIRLRIEDETDTLRVLDTRDYPGLLTQNASGQYVLNLFVLALNLQQLLGNDLEGLLDLRSLDLQLSSYDRAGNESDIVTLTDVNLLGPVVSLVDFTGSLVGVTDPGASVAVTVRLGGVTQTVTVGSDNNGAFAIDLLANPRLNFSLNDLLRASVTAVATDAQGNRSFAPVTVNLVDLLPVPLSTLDLSPITNLVVGGSGAVAALTNIVLPAGSELTATLDVGGLGTVNVPVTSGPGGTLSLNLGAALTSAVSTFNLLGGVAGLLTGRGATLTLEYTSPQGVVGTTEVALLGNALASLTFGAVRETVINGTEQADVLIVGAGQSVQALGGNDLIVLRSDAFASIDGGAGFNTLLVEGRQTLDLADFARMSNIQRINLGSTGSTVQLNAATASALAGEGDTLQILGGASNSLVISGAAASAGTTVIDGVTYRLIQLGDTTLAVNQGIALDFVPTINQTAGYIVSGGGEAGVAVAVQVGSTTYNTRVNEEGEWRLVLNQPAAAGSQIRAVVGGDTTETVSVPTPVAAPTGLSIRTPPLVGLLASFLEGSAVGAQTIRLDVYQDDLFSSLRSSTINVNANGTFSVGTTVLSNLLNSATSLLVGSEGVNVGFTAVRSDGSHSTTEVVHFGSAQSVFTNPVGAITSTLGGVIGGVLGSNHALPVTRSFYDGSDRADLVQGSARDQVFTTDDGNDVVISVGGRDVINTGDGDDVIVLRNNQFASIDGGEGFDIVALGAGINLNLTSTTVGDINNIERIALGKGNGANRLTLNRSALVELTDDDNVLQVTGDSQDRVDLAGGNWTRTATQTVDGVVFNEYVNQGAVLFIEQGISVVEVT